MGKLSPLCAPVLFFTLLLGNSAAIAAPAESKAVKVEFTATPAPSHGDDLLKTATTSSAKVTFADGSTRFLKFGQPFKPRNLWAVVPRVREIPLDF